jgi:hypothetical protein
MRKNELAHVVARERRRRASTSEVTQPSRAQFARVATAPPERLATIAVLPRRPSGNSRTDGWTVAVMVAALRRLRWTEHIALPLAAVVLAGVLGAAMPLLIDGGTAQGVAAIDIAAPIPASQASSDMGRSDRQRRIAGSPTRGRSTEPPQKSTLLARGGASPTGTSSAAVVAAQEEGSNALDQPSEAQAQSSEEGASEPSASASVEPDAEEPNPEPSAGVEPDAEQPTPEPSADPAPSSPVDEGAEEDEQAGGNVALCHKAGSKKPKAIVVREDAVEEHLTHGDTIGVCP